ncbi:MAG TPA: class III extradiol ring-cleavage dioxygenase [Planctomycetota bacterium]
MTTSPMPVGFVSHGEPTLALDPARGKDLTRWAAAMPRPRAVLVVSSRWLAAPPTLGTRTQRDLLYDFHGFPAELYRVRYAAPAAAALAADLEHLLPHLRKDDQRPWDHGVWVPLVHMYPAADVPVLQLSLPHAWSPRQLFELGRQLAPVRREGVLLLASGGAVHNPGRLDWSGKPRRPPAWATSFEDWLRRRLVSSAVDDIVAFREKAPDLALAHPTHEHFLPLLVALGAAVQHRGGVMFPITGFDLGALSRLAVQFG